jgi:hypothetical protein
MMEEIVKIVVVGESGENFWGLVFACVWSERSKFEK